MIKRRISATLVVAMLVTATLPVAAQPSWAKKATKSVFALKTFAADGTLQGSSTGFFTGERGEAVSPFSPFKGASAAVVIDADGRELPVACILGANDTYDVARFRVETKKSTPLPVSNTVAETGSAVWLLPYRGAKAATDGVVRKAETFKQQYGYYTVAMTMPEGSVGAPLMDASGHVVGIMQQPNRDGDSLSFAVSAVFADSLTINGLSINDPVLRSTLIKKDLPADLAQAQLTLYIGQASMDSAQYATLLGDFISRFPSSPDGYVYRAQMEASHRQFDAARADMERAISTAEKKDEAHYSYSQLIYQTLVYMPDTVYAPWTLDKAQDEARLAYESSPQPVYRRQQALVSYAAKRFAEAADLYATLYDSPLRSADLFYEAAKCHEAMGDTVGQLALMDSCVAQYSKPYLREAAPYLYARAQARISADRYRDAVADLNEYEKLMASTVNDHFYYVRHQADVGGRLYQQALNDIDEAISRRPDYDLYYAEKASLQVRVGLYDDAIATANECIRLSPDYSDGYLLLGLAQCQKGLTAQGVVNLRKASELGDPQAAQLIEKYGRGVDN